jgi:hypothetical protein
VGHLVATTPLSLRFGATPGAVRLARIQTLLDLQSELAFVA